jgi:CBS domain-containing protein
MNHLASGRRPAAKLRDLLEPSPVTAAPDEAAADACRRMRSCDVNYLLVVKDGRLLGVLSRDDLGGPAGCTHRRMGRRVGELMRASIVTATPETSVQRASALMRRHRIGCLPVVARGRLVGIVTVAHLLAWFEKELASH